MAQQPNYLPHSPTKRSKSLLLIGLVVALLLSYCLIHLFSHHAKTRFSNRTLSLPTLDAKKTESDRSEKDSGWTTIKTQSGDTLSSIFKRAGLSGQTLQAVLQNNQHAKILASIKLDQQIQLLIRDKQLRKLIMPISTTQFLVVSHDGLKYTTELKSRKMDGHNDYLTATVQGSLYLTAKRLNIPYKLVQQMTDILNWEIDFSKEVRTGDQFSIVYKAYYIDDKLVSTGEIIAVTYTNRESAHQAIRHESTTGDYDYFNPQGISLKKAFSRYPIKFSHISSTYSLSRYHPILHYSRPHKGVDLAASIGTPIHATGDGRVEVIERHSGYGNMIKISHNKIYTTLYAHLLRFQKGLSKGDHVKRGQIIGYVGQTGLADGPHCHYEFHINHQPKNPSAVALPRAMPVPAKEMASFKAKSSALLAQLKLYETAILVASGKNRANTA